MQRKNQERKYTGNGPAPRAAVKLLMVRRITLAMVRDAFYHFWSTEDYYAGDGSEYESRFMEWLESKKKMLSNEQSEYEKLVSVWRDLVKRKLAESEVKEYASAPVKEVEEASAKVCKETPPPLPPSKKRKKRKSRELGGHEQVHEYNCSLCSEVFHCYQALGGHMTAHRNSKQRLSLTASCEKVSSAEKLYACHNCKKEFKSGQALGGHMKEHWNAAVAARIIASAGSPVLETGMSISDVLP